MTSEFARTAAPAAIEEVIRDERAHLGLPPDDKSQMAMALCLSGGGIRSATFSLGVLQGLAHLKLLGKFHYLSSVSGGGYISTWLSAWISRSNREDVEKELAASTAGATSSRAGANEPAPIKNLRAYSNFLSPVHGVSADSAALLAICARNLLLHWAMVLPILFAFLLIPRFAHSLLAVVPGHFAGGPLSLYIPIASLLGVAVLTASLDVPLIGRLNPAEPKAPPETSWVWPGFVLPLIAATFGLLVANETVPKEKGFSVYESLCLVSLFGAFVGALAAGIGAVIRNQKDRPRIVELKSARREFLMFFFTNTTTGAAAGVLLWTASYGIDRYMPTTAAKVTFGFPLLIVALGLAAILRAGLSMRWTSEEVREWWGRASGLLGMIAAGWLGLALIVVQLPDWLLGWASRSSTLAVSVAGTGSVLLTIVTAFLGFWSEHGAQVKEKAASLSQALGTKVMELAAMVSVLVLALAASLFMGFVLTRHPFIGEKSLHDEECDARATLKVALTSTARVPSAKICTAVTSSTSAVAGDHTPARAEPGKPASPTSTSVRGNTAIEAYPGANIVVVDSEPSGEKPKSDADDAVPLDDRWAFQWLLRHALSLRVPTWYAILLLAAALLAAGVLASMLFGANTFSLNALYGNRLTRAYLGASRPKEKRFPHPFTGFDDHDNAALRSLMPAADASGGARLFPIINAALNLVKPSGDRLEWQQRKAASFFMTPRHCGSDVLGFVPTEHYGSQPNGLSAGRAMSVSGAAASPSMGYHSSLFVSALMAFFNVRLGWWMPNPKHRDVLTKGEPLVGLGPVATELMSHTSERSAFVYLSDGGHFENLGLYEMVRRRCHRILVVDAGYDPDYQYEDLENAIRKIRVDFGIEITFDQPLLRPDDARASDLHHFRGKILYSQSKDGTPDGEIIILKPVLTSGVPMDVRRYAASTRSDGRVFPQQPTSDQFFDEAQFESYRELGLHSVLRAFLSAAPGGDWPQAPTPPDEPDEKPADSVQSKKPPNWAPESKAASSAGVLASFGSLGQAAVLASAITVTAAVSVSVTGSVALKNAEVRLAPGSEILRVSTDTPLPVAMDPNTPIRVDVAGTLQAYLNRDGGRTRERIVSELSQILSDIQVKVNVVSGDAGDVGGNKSLDDAITKVATAARAVSDLVDQLRGSAIALDTTSGNLSAATLIFKNEVNRTVGALNSAIDRLNNSLAPVGGNVDVIRQTLVDDLEAIKTVLGDINREVRQISPRETVRGN